MGTQEGVSRFLKKQLPFVNYRHEPGNPHSLHRQHDPVRSGGQPGIPLDRDEARTQPAGSKNRARHFIPARSKKRPQPFLGTGLPQSAKAGQASYGLGPTMAAASTALTLRRGDPSPTGTTRRTLPA